MFKRVLVICLPTAFAISLAAAPNAAPSPAKFSASEIVDRNVAARGGLRAWRAVQTLTMSGKLGAGGNQRATLAMPNAEQPAGTRQIVSHRPVEETQLPFVMELKRPRKLRFELDFHGKMAVQVFDGANGWKIRPFLNRLEVEPYTPEEKKIASTQSDIDGPLVDYAAKGTRVDLDGMETINGRDTYKLKLTMKTGETSHVWIDAQTFLETKIEGQPRRLDGVEHPVEVYFSDYRPVSGLQMPHLLETRVLPVAKTALGFKDPPVPTEKIIIEKIEVNSKLDESLFTKPTVGAASNGGRSGR